MAVGNLVMWSCLWRADLHPTGERNTLVGWRCSHSFERVPVVTLSVVDLADEQVPFRVGCEAVRVEELPRVVSRVAANALDDLQCLTIENPDCLVGAVHGVEESLRLVRRCGEG